MFKFLPPLVLAFFLAGSGLAADGNALEKYLQTPDATFAWTSAGRMKSGEFEVARVEMTSQTWRSNVWTHHMLVVRPAQVRNPGMGFLFITGDGDGSQYLGMLKSVAARGGSMAAVVTRVPNQPLYGGKKEDALIAYTFEEYLKSGDETWPLLFPMVKSAVRAMDAVQEFAKKEFERGPEKFVVSGASKRGWTTWLAGAADPRVAAMAPMVIDMLNMKVQTQWAAKVYGKQSEQIKDYSDHDLIDRMDAPPMIKLRGWVDPYSYRGRYNVPILILLGTNDPYWTVDSLRHYWNELPEPKLIFQTPNAGHDLGGGQQATETLAVFFQMVADKQALPKESWKISYTANGNAEIAARLDRPVVGWKLWTADSDVRDFRKQRWNSRTLEANGMDAKAMVEKPASGYRAFLIEAELASADGAHYKLSTEARVVPDTQP